mgnify:FL=1|jgi:hypothetical protein
MAENKKNKGVIITALIIGAVAVGVYVITILLNS